MPAAKPAAVVRAEALLGRRAVSWRRAEGGYSPAQRWLIDFADGASCFAKAGVDAMTGAWLRAEHERIYARLEAPFLPRLYAWDDGPSPLLLLEDLSRAYWPPPWRDGDIERVLETLAAIHATPLDVPPIAELSDYANLTAGWQRVRADPATFLALGLCTPLWLEGAIDALVAASEAAPLVGDDLLHLDVRSDNICLLDEHVVIIDWNNACRGNGELDLAAWAPSLQAEGGPAPESLLPDAPGLAAFVTGYFAARAGLPRIPNAPRVREVQLRQLRTALPWTQRALGLSPLDGEMA